MRTSLSEVIPEPSVAQLRKFYEENKARYLTSPSRSFEYVYFSFASAKLPKKPQQFIQQLQESTDIAGLGDFSLMGNKFSKASFQTIAITFGKPYTPEVFNLASAATCLTLLDYETTVWTDVDRKSPAINWLQFGCGGSVVTEPCMANFAIITKLATMPALDYFRIGQHEYPGNVTTMVVQVDDILPAKDDRYSSIFADKAPQLELKGITDNFIF